MTHSFRGIVFSQIAFRETSIISKIFTESDGLQSYIVNGIRSARSKQNLANYQPLTLLEIEAYRNPSKDIQRLNDSKIAYTPQSFHQVKKSTVLIFLSEILAKTLRHEVDENTLFFKFLWDSIITYDKLEKDYENFHISFLIQLSKHLGFDLSSESELENLSNGDTELLDYLLKVSTQDYFQWHPVSGDMRNKVLQNLVKQYQHHIDHLTEIKSLKVLRTVFHS